jgi:hypothetical protein
VRAYTAVIEKCPDTGLFVGYIPGLRGAHSQGETLDELNQNLKAEIIGEYCAKGSRIGVRGQLQYRQWQNDEGGNHSLVEIRARELELLSGKNGKPAAAEEETPPTATEDDEISF